MDKPIAILNYTGGLLYAEAGDKLLWPNPGESFLDFVKRLRQEGYQYVFETYRKKKKL